MTPLERVRRDYGFLLTIGRWIDAVAADVPPAHRDHADRVVVDVDLLEDLSDIVEWARTRELLLGIETLNALRGFDRRFTAFWTQTPPTLKEWESFAAEVRSWRSRGAWAHGLSQEEYELVHYWADA